MPLQTATLWGLVENAGTDLPLTLQRLMRRLYGHLVELDEQVKDLEAQIREWHRQSERNRHAEAALTA